MNEQDISKLREELTKKRGEIYTDQLTMSVGELINLYRDNEIELEPAFQRLFRWSEVQETNFIESILLGYPIPPIFILQRDDGIWDVIDGVQRLSTIYHFVGILKPTKNSEKKTPLKLESAEILTHLEGKYYSEEQGDEYLDSATRIDFKRSAISILILKSGSDPKSKFELFKRLNTGGTSLSDQEMRNSMILMYNDEIYNAMEEFSKRQSFKTMINIPDSYSKERMDMDILTRFLIMRNYNDIENVPNTTDINVFLDKAIEGIIAEDNFYIHKELDVLDRLIKFLSTHLQEDYGFRIYDHKKGLFVQSFNWFVFEVLIWGCAVLNDVDSLKDNPDFYIDRIKRLQSIGEYKKKINKSNIRAIERFKLAKKEAKEIFCND
ncbi:DUF262 domain-containing protein [Clostridium cochlearium]|uniref:DUF262 domain-containing protein n=1 Tax=Clostridium cochlearium TaxID=1494 RepID=UPI001C0F31E1|nr:DUF262 domain-containing protein [Clostridium cochlearium]MBU5269439.1 DUF262 domain-containing protein [Clostridium cochlearium]